MGLTLVLCVEQWKKSAKELWRQQQHTDEFYGKPISGGHIKGNIKFY